MAEKRFRIGLLGRVAIAITAGILLGLVAPEWLARSAATVTGLFGNFLGFVIPLIILGLVAPGIADIGTGAGKLLIITVVIAYGSTLFSGFFTYGVCSAAYPWLLRGTVGFGDVAAGEETAAYFAVEMPP